MVSGEVLGPFLFRGIMAKTKINNEEILNNFFMAMQFGNYLETCAAFAGLNQDTIHTWMERGAREEERAQKELEKHNLAAKQQRRALKYRPEEIAYVDFHFRLKKSMAEAEMRLLGIIHKAAETNWTAAAWILERTRPDRFGKRLEYSGPHGNPIDLTVRMATGEALDQEEKNGIGSDPNPAPDSPQ